MTQLIKNLWHDPVWSKVISSAFIAVGAAISIYIFNWWSAFTEVVLSGYHFALTSSLIPNWVSVLTGLLALPTLVLIFVITWQVIFPSKPSIPSWQNYKEDIFYKLKWQWNYTNTGQIFDVTIFCPHCNYQVFARRISSYGVIDPIIFHCDSCGRQLAEFEESIDSLTSKVRRFIQQKIRNDSWISKSTE